MNNPNPFVPQGSLQDQQNKRRKQMKIGVYCVLTFGVAGLMVMLIQGCTEKKAETPDNGLPGGDATNTTMTAPDTTTTTQPTDTNVAPMTPPTNLATTPNINTQPPSPVATTSLPVAQMPPQLPPTQPVSLPPTAPVTDTAGAGEYTVVKGDSLAKIAKKNGVSLKALEAANPDAKPSKLKIGQKLVLPAGGKAPTEATTATGTETADTNSETYIVKSGDTITKIAKAHHVKVKALMAANHLTTAQIKVGKKLKIPAGSAVAPTPIDATAVPLPATTTPVPPLPAASPAPLLTQPTSIPATH